MLNWTATIWPVAVGIAIKSTMLLAAAWLAALILRARSAASRHIVWTACAAGLLALPLLSIWLPDVNLFPDLPWRPLDGALGPPRWSWPS